LKTNDFNYDLPESFIAQTPIEPRDTSRLLVYRRLNQSISHMHFHQLMNFLNPGDVLVLNQTRVYPARLFGHKKPGGGKVEILLLKQLDETTWTALVGGKGLVEGREVDLQQGYNLKILQVMNGSERVICFNQSINPYLRIFGQVPLPPYIHQNLENPERYQTIYSRMEGSAAAPTAGLHFTQELLENIQKHKISIAFVTLHVGLDTFLPVSEERPEDHAIHSEWCQVHSETADVINQAKARGNRVIAVGTTTVRTLETATQVKGMVRTVVPYEGYTRLYILPGFQFKTLDGMLTNFHLPRSTLIMMVSAFAGWKNIHTVYELAKFLNYRFYSFGDAMLIL
jgi:S-adenosylmethionine:tRNA ribosyltransferase-isomerase